MKFEEYQVKVYDNGDTLWYQNGLLHRLDGPAVEFVNGDKQYWIEGVQYTKAQFLVKVSPPASCAGKIVEFEGKKYRLEEVKE